MIRVLAACCILSLSIDPALARELSGNARVRDADTIVVYGTPVRLNGCDAPDNSTQAVGDATNFLKRLLRGKTVVCNLNGDRTYDRWVGGCFIEVSGQWNNIGAIVIADGHALDCRRYSGSRYRSLEQASARQRLRRVKYCGNRHRAIKLLKNYDYA